MGCSYGWVGGVILVVAGITDFILAIWVGGFGFGGGKLSPNEDLIISIIVLILISLGAGIPAWALGVNRWQGLIAGLVAMAIFIYVDNKGPDINYAPFIDYETRAYIIAIFASVLIAIVEKNKFRLGWLVVCHT